MSERNMTPLEAWMRELAAREPWPSHDTGPCPDDEILATRIEGGSQDSMHREALDSHLVSCDRCREVVQDLILDGAGEHLPLPSPAASPAEPRWAGVLQALIPRRLVASFGPIALTLVAVTALAAVAMPVAMRMIQDATARPTPVQTVWTVTGTDLEPAGAVAAPSAPEETLPAEVEELDQETTPVAASAPSKRPLRKVRTLRATQTPTPAVAPLPTNEANGIILPKLEPAPVIKPAPVVEPPAPLPIVTKQAFTHADEVFVDHLTAIGVLHHEGKYAEALERIERLKAVASHNVFYTGVVNKLRNEAFRGLRKQRGPCKPGYVWGTYRETSNTIAQRCVLPEEAQKLLDR